MSEKEVISELLQIISYLTYSVDMGNDDRTLIHQRLVKIQNEYIYKDEASVN